MARPTFRKTSSNQRAILWHSLILLGSQLLASFAPLPLLSMEFQLLALTRETFAPPNGDESDDSREEAAHYSSRLPRSLATAAQLETAPRRRLARAFHPPVESGQLESVLKLLLHNPLVSSRAYPFALLSGCEHGQRHGLGTPLRC